MVYKPLAADLRGAASLTGLGRTTLRAYIRTNYLPATRCGRKLLIQVTDLEWLVRNGAPTRTELAAKP